MTAEYVSSRSLWFSTTRIHTVNKQDNLALSYLRFQLSLLKTGDHFYLIVLVLFIVVIEQKSVSATSVERLPRAGILLQR